MDENEIQDIDEQLEPEQAPAVKAPREGIAWGAILLVIWAVVLIVFSVQNAESVTVEFLSWDFDLSIAVLVMLTALATLIISTLSSAVYRRRRRKRREMKEARRSAG